MVNIKSSTCPKVSQPVINEINSLHLKIMNSFTVSSSYIELEVGYSSGWL